MHLSYGMIGVWWFLHTFLLSGGGGVVHAQQQQQTNFASNFTMLNGHFYELYDNAPMTWEEAKVVAENAIRIGCYGFGHLVTIDSDQEDRVVSDLCASSNGSSSCWIGLSREDTSTPAEWSWEWVTGDALEYKDHDQGSWDGTEPDGDGRCVSVVGGGGGTDNATWGDESCTTQLPYVVEYDCEPSGLAYDGDWDVAFFDAVAVFDNGPNETKPEVTLFYNASASTLPVKYYKQQIMLPGEDGKCVVAVSGADAAITPQTVGVLPAWAFNTSTGLLTTYVDINTTIIEGSEFWKHNATTNNSTIDFCVRMDLYNEQHLSLAMEATRVTLYVDMTTSIGGDDGFSLFGMETEVLTVKEASVAVDYPILVKFCNDANEPVSPAPDLFPGDLLQICISTPTTDAKVTDVRSVAFENDLVQIFGQSLRIVVIDEDGIEANGQTVKNCDADAGICNIQTVTFSTLYQYDTDENGDLEDVSARSTLVGTAVLTFARRTRRRNLREQQRVLSRSEESAFDFDLYENLVLPEPVGSRDANNRKKTAGVATGVVLVAAAVAGVGFFMYKRNHANPTTAK